MPDRTCAIAGCERPARTRGWCGTHYARWRKHGDPHHLERGRGLPLADRLLMHVDKRDGHWLWTASILSNGYGNVTIDGKACKAHRASYEAFVGPIPEGLHIDHLCRVRHCINPAHLEPVTCAENVRRSPIANGSRTHCPQGHPYDAENTYHYRGRRYCRACQRINFRRWYDKHKRAS